MVVRRVWDVVVRVGVGRGCEGGCEVVLRVFI